MAGRLIWTGYAAAGLAVLRLPVHLYYGLGGTAGLSTADPSIAALPDRLSPLAAGFVWRAAHLGTALLLAAVAVLAVALVRPWGRRLPSYALVVPAFAVTVVTLGYAVGGAASATTRLAANVVPNDPMPDSVPAALDGVLAFGRTGGGGVADRIADAFAALGSSGPERAALHYAQWLGDQPLAAYQMGALTPWALALGLLLAVAVAYRLGGVTARRIWLVAVALGVLRLLV